MNSKTAILLVVLGTIFAVLINYFLIYPLANSVKTDPLNLVLLTCSLLLVTGYLLKHKLVH